MSTQTTTTPSRSKDTLAEEMEAIEQLGEGRESRQLGQRKVLETGKVNPSEISAYMSLETPETSEELLKLVGEVGLKTDFSVTKQAYSKFKKVAISLDGIEILDGLNCDYLVVFQKINETLRELASKSGFSGAAVDGFLMALGFWFTTSASNKTIKPKITIKGELHDLGSFLEMIGVEESGIDADPENVTANRIRLFLSGYASVLVSAAQGMGREGAIMVRAFKKLRGIALPLANPSCLPYVTLNERKNYLTALKGFEKVFATFDKRKKVKTTSEGRWSVTAENFFIRYKTPFAFPAVNVNEAYNAFKEQNRSSSPE